MSQYNTRSSSIICIDTRSSSVCECIQFVCTWHCVCVCMYMCLTITLYVWHCVCTMQLMDMVDSEMITDPAATEQQNLIRWRSTAASDAFKLQEETLYNRRVADVQLQLENIGANFTVAITLCCKIKELPTLTKKHRLWGIKLRWQEELLLQWGFDAATCVGCTKSIEFPSWSTHNTWEVRCTGISMIYMKRYHNACTPWE